MTIRQFLVIPFLAMAIGCSDSNSTTDTGGGNNSPVLDTHINGSVTDSSGVPISDIEVRLLYKLNHIDRTENVDVMAIKFDVPESQTITITIHPPQGASDSIVFNALLNAGAYTQTVTRFNQMGIYRAIVSGKSVHDTSYYLCEHGDLSTFSGAIPYATTDASGNYKIDLNSSDFGRLIVNSYGFPILDTISKQVELQFIPKTTYRFTTQTITVNPGSSISTEVKMAK